MSLMPCNLTLDPSILHKLSDLAEARGISRRQLIRETLEDLVNELEETDGPK